MANERENILRTVFFDRPDHIPMVFHINASCWNHYPDEALKELIESHPFLFAGRENAPGRTELDDETLERVGRPFTDGWGCVWETAMDGIVGSVTGHPLSNWDNFDLYNPADPEVDSGKGPIDWNKIAQDIRVAKSAGQLAVGGLRHGHTFQTLTDIRGYENLIFDMFHKDPRLDKLIAMVEDFNMAIVKRYINLGIEWMCYPEDLGMQTGPMLSPNLFRQYIKPSYERLMAPACAKNLIVHMHSDGHIHDLVEDLINGGVNVLNLQDLVNGIDWIKENLTGRICIDLDIDRQNITPHGTSKQIDALIHQEVEKLGSKQGGLMMIYGLYPGVPLENIKALMDAMEKYATYYS